MELLHKDITEKILKSFFKVYNELGFGFLEKVYQNALLIQLQKENLVCVKQAPIKVFYEGNNVGDYFADIIVEGLVIIELKAAAVLVDEHEYQLINYLKATPIEVGLLLNFGKSPEFRRKVFANNRKRISVDLLHQRHPRSIS